MGRERQDHFRKQWLQKEEKACDSIVLHDLVERQWEVKQLVRIASERKLWPIGAAPPRREAAPWLEQKGEQEQEQDWQLRPRKKKKNKNKEGKCTTQRLWARGWFAGRT